MYAPIGKSSTLNYVVSFGYKICLISCDFHEQHLFLQGFTYFRIGVVWLMAFYATFNNILVISWRSFVFVDIFTLTNILYMLAFRLTAKMPKGGEEMHSIINIEKKRKKKIILTYCL
jgi:hypothetical protein